jgi:hypothetical protein
LSESTDTLAIQGTGESQHPNFANVLNARHRLVAAILCLRRTKAFVIAPCELSPTPGSYGA